MQIPYVLLLLVALALVKASLQKPNCIAGCKCKEDNTFARKLEINDCNSPIVLTSSIFADICKTITTISFKNVVINTIERDAFEGLNELEAVIIQDSKVKIVDPLAFNSQLSTISFTKTTFDEIPELKSIHLEELIFNDCKLTEVPNLEQLPALTFVNLANNYIEDIDEKTFAKAEVLEEVTLSNNRITKLPFNLFSTNQNFNTLNVDYNPLKSFELNLTSDLEFLSLRYCKLSNFDRTATRNLASVSSLDLSGNQISILPIDAFQIMTDLNYLDLSHNKLVELDDNIFLANKKLDRIILDNNNFESLPNFQTTNKIFMTYHFSCQNCGLKSVKNAFEHMPGLVSIDLSHNQIKDIEGVFSKMQGLQKLNLGYNNITSIEATTFAKDVELQTLILSHNPLKPLDPVVFGSIKLTKLDISNCSLVQLWANRKKTIDSLEQLLARKNNFTVITVEDVGITPALRLLDLQDNPLQCTSELHDLLQYLLKHSIYPIEQSDILKTHESLMSGTGDESVNNKSAWKKLATDCDMNLIFDEEVDDDDDDDDEDDDDSDEDDIYDNMLDQSKKTTLNYDLDDDDYDDENEDDTDKNNVDDVYLVDANIMNDRNLSLARASYILSITSVFILTALVVLTVAVAVTLLILKRNKSFNMHNGNLPRLKIPLWHTTPGQKKHSGSVYKPLSEDLSGPRTPIINRYEFKQTPQVHNSIP